MEISNKILEELQKRLKIGNRRGVHLNAIPGKSSYKFDLNRLSNIDSKLPERFIEALLSEFPLRFKISLKNNSKIDFESLFEEEQAQLVRITKAFDNLINQTESIESEKGINTFGFGFPLLIRRDKSDNQLTVAPILIWSLKIKRDQEFNTWVIQRNEESSIYVNEVLINHIQSDQPPVQIKQISEDMLEDGKIDNNELVEICYDLLQTINHKSALPSKNELLEKLKKIKSISTKQTYENIPNLGYANSFIDFAGLFSIFEIQKQNIISDYSDLISDERTELDLSDIENNNFQSVTSVETDPTQQSILHALEDKRNILIQGPPGTGKSQTLSAILINALENGKKTIVVCEKKTALDILYKSLNNKGLSDYCALIEDTKNDRRKIVDSVKSRINGTSYLNSRYTFSNEILLTLVNRIKVIINTVNGCHEKLNKSLIEEKNWTKIVGEYLAYLRKDADGFKFSFGSHKFKFNIQEMTHYSNLMEQGEKLYSEYEPIKTLSFIKKEKFEVENPFLLEKSIKEDFYEYEQIISTIRVLQDKLKVEYFEYRKNELLEQINNVKNKLEKINKLEVEFEIYISNLREKYLQIRGDEFANQIQTAENIMLEMNPLIENNKLNSEFTDRNKITGFSYKLQALFSKKKKQIISDHFHLVDLFSRLNIESVKFKDLNIFCLKDGLESNIQNLQNYKETLQKESKILIEKITSEFIYFHFQSFLNSESERNKIRNLITKAVNDVRNQPDFNSHLQLVLSSLDSKWEEIRTANQLLSDLIKQSKDLNRYCNFEPINDQSINKEQFITIDSGFIIAESKFEENISIEFNNIDFINKNLKSFSSQIVEFQNQLFRLKNKIIGDNWVEIKERKTSLNEYLNSVDLIVKKKNDYFNHHQNLIHIEYKWYNFINKLSTFEKSLIKQLSSDKNWQMKFLINYLNTLLYQSAELGLQIDRSEYENLNQCFDRLEHEQLKFILSYWRAKQLNAARRFDNQNAIHNFTISNLYNLRASTNHRRLSLRKIVLRDIDLFTDFFPIILTSPDIASSLFKGKKQYFDIVMFDEASQLRLEDNLPAITKGKQIVIAGDEHQMPPSNYFSKVYDGQVDDEDDIEEDEINNLTVFGSLLASESLLDFADQLQFQKKHLDFHYRSKHPYLIDFSNFAFYKQRLKPLPNTFDYTPIKYIQVNGTFSDHTNEAEAEMVLSIIENNINMKPDGTYPSVGIATFNISQRNLIKDKILERRKFTKYAQFNEKILALETNKESLFVKNLENIQGDERDVIILSTTYGISKDGKFSQRYGPLNHTKGYRLLNVIVTRAKYKIYVCTSIPESIFFQYSDFLTTEGNNKRGAFYSYLAYAKAVSESNEEERQNVLKALSLQSAINVNGYIFNEDLESPFEEEVYESLVEHFGPENIKIQYPFAGFRIDMVYDAKVEGIPKIAIECDGAKYHSSREAYLYDKHRQAILENNGFVFHRIWSTNWWQNRKRETDILVSFIKSVVDTEFQNSITDVNISGAFNDDIVEIEKFINSNSLYTINNESIIIESLAEANDVIDFSIPKKPIVELNSKVEIKYLSNDKTIVVQLVNIEQNKHEVTDGFQKIYVKSLLGVSLLKKEVGDIVKIGQLDNYVEIMNIDNLAN